MIRIGTRGSALALRQTAIVRDRLVAQGVDVEIVTIRTEGDRLVDQGLAEVGGKGLFVKEIEQALLEKRIDVAVHSLKDLPADVPPGLSLSAYLEREDPRDVLVGKVTDTLPALPERARVGTSSPRRRALLLSVRPDLRVEPLRGNVDTRLGKLAAGDLDAIVIAAAGLVRLGLAPPHAVPLDPDVFVPAVGQGIIAVEAREDDPSVVRWLAALDAPETRACARAERAFLERLGASCVTPTAAHATIGDGRLHVTGVVASEDGRRVIRGSMRGARDAAATLGRSLAEDLLARGAADITPLRPEAHG